MANETLFQSLFPDWEGDPQREFLYEKWNTQQLSQVSLEELIHLRRLILRDLFQEQFQPDVPLQKALFKLSDFYDELLRTLIQRHARDLDLDLENGGVAVFALGKLGSREVNVDSDVDLTFVKLPTLTETEVRRWEKLIQKLNEDLTTETAHGHLPRLDLDLRPYGRGGQILPSVELMQNFYWHSTDLWNRLSWLRGRRLLGDLRVEETLQQWLPSYVYPKHLDFRLIEHLHALHEKIRRVPEHAHNAGSWKIKYGPGGIRVLEMTLHGLVLLHGGRRPEGRTGNVFGVCDYIERHQLLSEETKNLLLRAYTTLRRIEHFSQVSESARTYVLKRSREAHPLVVLALKLGGWKSVQALLQDVEAATQDRLRSKKRSASTELQIPEGMRQVLEPYLNEKLLQRWTSEARERWQLILPQLIESVASFSDPEKVLVQFLLWVDRLKIRGGYFHLLLENPGLLQRLLRLLSVNSALINEWLSRPRCIENLILGSWDGREDFQEFWADWKKELATQENDQNDALRECRTTFALEIIQRQLFHPGEWRLYQRLWNRVADAVMKEVLEQEAKALGLKGKKTEPLMTFLVLGSHGGLVADLFSDLDLLILLHDEAQILQDRCIRLSQKFVSVLTQRSTAGMLYPVDLRLRPSGAQGPMVVSKNYFYKYALEGSGLWEWLSWFRAREVVTLFGDGSIGTTEHWFHRTVLTDFTRALREGKKQFTVQDVEKIDTYLKEHLSKTENQLKWSSTGLIATDVRARFRAWYQTSDAPEESDFETFCNRMLPESWKHWIEQLTWQSWHHRLVPFRAGVDLKPPTQTSLTEDVSGFLKQT